MIQKCILILSGVAILLLKAGANPATEVESQEVRVITWNAGGIFYMKDGKNGLAGREGDIKELADKLNPDVVLIQEVTSESQVRKIRDWLGLPYYAISDFFRDDVPQGYERLEVAVVSRYPLKNVTEYDPSPDKRSVTLTENPLTLPDWADPSILQKERGFLSFEMESLKTLGVVVHLKSSGGRGDDRLEKAPKREAQAAAVANTISTWLKTNPEGTVVLGGDFNVGESDVKKIGKDLENDSTDGYDDTHAIISGGLVEELKMKSLSKGLGPTYTGGDFGPTGPIDCLYVAGKNADVFRPAVRSESAFGSDHLAVVAIADLSRHGEAVDEEVDVSSEYPASREQLVGTLWVQNAAEFEALTRQTYRWASQNLRSLKDDPMWSADLAQRSRGSFHHLPPAVILDVDETVLDNSPSQARLILNSADGYDEAAWNAWVLEKRARAIPGAVAFVSLAQRLGVKVYFVTNRDASVSGTKAATLDNLRAEGFIIDSKQLMLLNEKEEWDGKKLERRAVVASEYRILMLIGDDLNDCLPMKGISPEARKDKVFGYDDLLGKGWFVIPNPIYGSWYFRPWGKPPLEGLYPHLERESEGNVRSTMALDVIFSKDQRIRALEKELAESRKILSDVKNFLNLDEPR